MLRENCKVGMVVEFGRENGQKTKGQVIKMNPKMAKVKILEARGQRSGEGAIWNVAYSLITAQFPEAMPTNTVEELNKFDRMNEQVHYSPFMPHAEVCIMEAIVSTYNELSPENLSCDGELSITQVHVRRGKLENRLNHLFKALGRTVSESSAYSWAEQRELRKAN